MCVYVCVCMCVCVREREREKGEGGRGRRREGGMKILYKIDQHPSMRYLTLVLSDNIHGMV